VRVTGPIWFELPYPDVEIPEGDGPLVVVAPSTAQDPDGRLVQVALEALADEPVRVLATTNRPGVPLPEAPANAVVVEWLRYSQAMGAADLVICHGGHGTIARALGAGVPVISCPAAGDMAENGARVAWAGAGLMVPWRLASPSALRVVARKALVGRRYRDGAHEMGAWATANSGPTHAAEAVAASVRHT
jgi:UDP:flavonoid glycosyltransferase YjiC (YdhE family)